MKRLLGLLLVMELGGCGGDDAAPPAVPSTPNNSQVNVDEPPAPAADDAVAALKKLGAEIERNEQGEVIGVSIALRKFTDPDLVHLKGFAELQSIELVTTQITDLGLVHRKGLTSLQEELNLVGTQITGAGLVHLKGLTNLENVVLINTKVTDAGVAELKKALPKCEISK